jgi:predicted Fe-S protein YdhL (DUF1289 family)
MTTKAHCNGCLGERNHEILYIHESQEDHEDYGGPCFYGKYELLKCLGCERIVLRVSSWDNWEIDEQRNPIIKIQYYPQAISRPRPQWFRELSRIENSEKSECTYIQDILQEIYIGLQNESIRLATLGIRTLLEFIMIKKVGDNKTFKNNLSEFEKHGYISTGQREILCTVLETGHATMHRSYSPTKDDLITCMDITESVIATIYVHPSKVKELSKKIPKRK